jgi:hypothetical protein
MGEVSVKAERINQPSRAGATRTQFHVAALATPTH